MLLHVFGGGIELLSRAMGLALLLGILGSGGEGMIVLRAGNDLVVNASDDLFHGLPGVGIDGLLWSRFGFWLCRGNVGIRRHARLLHNRGLGLGILSLSGLVLRRER